jgi:hypothetical protein
MSSCQGELPEREFEVKVIDEDGTILANGTVATLRNGFFELWLPRNRVVNLFIRGSGRSARGTIETFEDSKTCETTFRLR